MTPEQKALIDAKREGFIAARNVIIPDPTPEEMRDWIEEATEKYPYPPERRVVKDEHGNSYRVSEDGNYIEQYEESRDRWILAREYVYYRDVVRLFHDLFENPDELSTAANEIVGKGKYHSCSTDDIWEVTEYLDGRLTCTCPGFKFREECWHTKDYYKS